MKNISIIVPTYNEEGSIPTLIKRVHNEMEKNKINYELLFIDDNSSDNTINEIRRCSSNLPVSWQKKKGQKGKAFSLLQGFEKANHDVVAMIDADLQYPPEAISNMYELIDKEGADIVVADREYKNVAFMRNFISKTFKYIFGNFLHGLNVDVQSGLKIFNKEIIERIDVNPSPWTFDLEFLLKGRSAGYEIRSYKVPFTQRLFGKAKVDLIRSSWEIGKNALKLKLKKDESIRLSKSHPFADFGFEYKGDEYVHHSKIDIFFTALTTFTMRQKLILASIFFVFAAGLIFYTKTTLIIAISLISIIYFVDLLYNIYLMLKGFNENVEVNVSRDQTTSLDGEELPTYTILCPMYKESSVLDQFVNAINAIDYPKDKLQVMLLLEEDDEETRSYVASEIVLPPHFQVEVVPFSKPKTKPKACNYGLKKAKGEYVVIFDAEDMPERDQLKKVVYAFKKSKKDIGCIQAKLRFYNVHHNLLTRLFTAEYALWFDLTLLGLQSAASPIPLGGTSNHFPTKLLRKLGGWDAFNVTEDCELGIRLAKNGYKTKIINSSTLEEANSEVVNWLNQRTRWIKGYIQTYFVHNRSNWKKYSSLSLKNTISFHLTVGGKVFCALVNPIMWTLTILYVFFRSSIGLYIESLFPRAVFYIAIISMIVGNFIYLYSYMIASAKLKRYELIKYMFVVPVYWLFMSIAAWVSVYRLIKAPHHWSKTVHGLHLKSKNQNNNNIYINNQFSNYAQT